MKLYIRYTVLCLLFGVFLAGCQQIPEEIVTEDLQTLPQIYTEASISDEEELPKPTDLQDNDATTLTTEETSAITEPTQDHAPEVSVKPTQGNRDEETNPAEVPQDTDPTAPPVIVEPTEPEATEVVDPPEVTVETTQPETFLDEDELPPIPIS